MSRFLTRLREDRVLLFSLLTALAAALACTLRTLAFFTAFDADIGYFRTASVLVIASGVCTVVCLGLGVTVSFLINIRGVSDEKNALSSPRFATAAANAILFAVVALLTIFRAEVIPASATLVLLAGICLLASAAYFLLRLLNSSTKSAATFGFFTILAPAMMLGVTYFDRYTQMNAPHKLSLHLCALAVMFAMLYEERALLSRPLPRACAVATTVAASLCAIYALSNAIAFLGGVYDDLTYFLFDLITLGFAAWFITKCARRPVTPNAKQEEVAE